VRSAFSDTNSMVDLGVHFDSNLTSQKKINKAYSGLLHFLA